METRPDLRYTRDHEWVRVESDRLVIGITDYAQDALGDVVFADIPAVGGHAAAGEGVAEVESTKTVSSVLAPVAGEVIAVHDELGANPNWLNTDPYGEGWMFAIKADDSAAVEALMDEAAYRAYVESIST